MKSQNQLPNEEDNFDSDLEQVIRGREFISPKKSSSNLILQAAGEISSTPESSKQVFPWMLIAASILGIFIFSFLYAPEKHQQTASQPLIQKDEPMDFDLSDDFIESKIASLEYRTISMVRGAGLTNYKPISKTSYFKNLKQISNRLKYVKTKIPRVEQDSIEIPEKSNSPNSKVIKNNIINQEA